ncbi:MAG: hypothetical protein NVS3B17_24090 [Vulcanimicrobiaceae bacterium]
MNYAAHRGSILDRDGTALVRSLPSQSVYATTHDIVDGRATARALSNVLTERSLASLTAALLSPSSYVQIQHKVTREQSDLIAKLALPGISIVCCAVRRERWCSKRINSVARSPSRSPTSSCRPNRAIRSR